MAGLTPTGFIPKTVLEIVTELQTTQRSTVDGSLNTSATSVLGNINAAFALQIGQLWELAQEIYEAHDPATAEGVANDHNGALIGVPREPATKSTTTLQLTFSGPATVPAGSVVSNPLNSQNIRFATDTTVTYPGPGAGAATVSATATVTGPIEALAGSLTKIESTVPNWTAATNPNPAIRGQNVETDEAYRQRQAEQRATVGGSTLPGIVADVAALPGVLSAAGRENVGNTTDGFGLPAKSFEIIVRDGSPTPIAETIWASKPAGIQTYGTTTVVITDSEGISQNVRYTPALPTQIYGRYTATTDAAYVPQSIADAIELASADPTSDLYLDINKPAYLVRMLSLAATLPGVVNVTMDIDYFMPATSVPSSPNKTLTPPATHYLAFGPGSWLGP